MVCSSYFWRFWKRFGDREQYKYREHKDAPSKMGRRGVLNFSSLECRAGNSS